jgi:hypothetical protein
MRSSSNYQVLDLTLRPSGTTRWFLFEGMCYFCIKNSWVKHPVWHSSYNVVLLYRRTLSNMVLFKPKTEVKLYLLKKPGFFFLISNFFFANFYFYVHSYFHWNILIAFADAVNSTVNSRFKKDLKLQIHLHKAFFSNHQFLDSLHKSFLNQRTLDLRNKKWTFLNREFTVCMFCDFGS